MTNEPQAFNPEDPLRSSQTYVILTAFLSLLAIVGFALYGVPFFYDFMSKEFGWSRTIVTSGNALGKIVVAPLFGFIAGWVLCTPLSCFTYSLFLTPWVMFSEDLYHVRF
jgi:hypothetical protein